MYHASCLSPPVLYPDVITDRHKYNTGDEDEDDADLRWSCKACGMVNGNPKDEDKLVRMGLTPDWIIHEAAFNMFKLKEPTLERPYIQGNGRNKKSKWKPKEREDEGCIEHC